ncbi:MAG: hypothetical protein HOO96_28940, partial [Polyangiaceae bacterium]|nr:hypothetical protein [Polyangiaceae bacterium]
MKPHRPQETRKSRTVAQVRMHLKGTLGWLEGYPAERSASGALRWVVPAPSSAEHREVDRALVARSVRTVKELASDFPDALPEVVGDVKAFVAGAERVTRWAAVAIRDGVPQASLFDLEPAYGRAAGAMARDLMARFPVLRSTVVALSFRGLVHPRDAVASLAHLAARGDAFARATPHVRDTPPERLWLELDAVRRNHPTAVTRGLERVLLDPRTHDAAVREGGAQARALHKALQRLAKGKTATLPSVAPPANTSFGHALAKWMPALGAMDGAAQKRALALFDLLGPLETVERWHTFWETLQLLAGRASALQRAMNAAQRAGTAAPRGIGELERKTAALLATLPPDENPARLLEAISALSRPESRAVYTEAVATLAMVPPLLGGRPLRAELLVDWSTDRYGSDWPKLLRGFVSGLRTLLEHAEDPAPLLHPFVVAARRGLYSSLTSSIAHELLTPAMRARFFAVWAARARADLPPWSDELALLLARTVPHAPDAEAAAAWLDHLAKAEGYVSSELIAFASTLADGDGGTFGTLVDLARKTRFDHRDTLGFERWMKGAERVALVRQALLDGHVSLLETAFSHMDTLANADRPVPDPFAPREPMPTTASLREYPPELRPALGRLAALVADPDATIARLLGPAFRSRGELERELRAIHTKRATADTVPLARRAAALERQRDAILADPSRSTLAAMRASFSADVEREGSARI